jgi:hypothetical protein
MANRFLLLFTVVLLAAFMLAQGQYESQSGQSQTGSMTSSQTSGQTTIEGCLQASGDSYTLTDSAGKTYQLQGDASKLSAHSGHQVRLTGTTSGDSGSASGMTSGAASSQPTFVVSNLKHISSTCQSSNK